ncbi:TPA: Ig-like domain-containing protein [Aeromonas hydrophila]
MTKWMISVWCLLLAGCGGGTDGAVPAPGPCERIVSVQVAPVEEGLEGTRELALPVGARLALAATLTYCDGTTAVVREGVTWRTDSAAAEVDEAGEVTARSPGVVRVLARSEPEGVEGAAVLTVTDATLVDVSVTPVALSVPVGLSAPLTAMARYSDETTLDVSSQVRWESEAPDRVAVNARGEVRGVAVGTARVSAFLGEQVAHSEVTVSDAVITGLSVTPSVARLPAGLVQRYWVWATDSEGGRYDVTDQVRWTLSQPAVATLVSPGLVRTTAAGRTALQVSLGEVSSSAALTVSDATLVELSVSPQTATQVVGGRQTYFASALYSDGARWDATPAVSWSSDAPQVASISPAGQASALAAGEATITATLLGEQGQGTLTVKPGILTRLTLEDGLTRLPKGASTAFRALATYDNGLLDDVTARVAWFVAEHDRDVLSVDASGRVTGLTVGSATLYADLDDQRASVQLSVTAQGTVVTWGLPDFGGDSSAVADQLTNVREVVGSSGAFAALRADGRVVTWGDPKSGGDSSAVQSQLNNVASLYGNLGGFAALRADGSVVTWPQSASYCNQHWIDTPVTTDVVSISTTDCAFAGIRSDGTVVTWGSSLSGGDSAQVSADLRGVRQIVASQHRFAALLATGEAIMWGGSDEAPTTLQDVVNVVSTVGDFVVLTREGRVMRWPTPLDVGIQEKMEGVQSIHGTLGVFAALKANGTLVLSSGVQYEGVQQVFRAHPNGFIIINTAGDIEYISPIDNFRIDSRPLNAVFAGSLSTALLYNDGSVVTVGPAENYPPSIPLVDVVTITATTTPSNLNYNDAFAAITQDGRVITWGDNFEGADSEAVQNALRNVTAIYSNYVAFAAVIGDAP